MLEVRKTFDCRGQLLVGDFGVGQGCYDRSCPALNRAGELRGVGLFDQWGHRGELCLQRREVVAHDLQALRVTQDLVLQGDALERAQVFLEQPVVIGRCHARGHEAFTLLGDPIDVDERPDDGQQQRRRHESKPDQDQFVE